MTTPNPKPQFLILMRQPPGTPPAPAELQKIMGQFQTWMESIKAKHELIGTNGLAPTTGKVFRGPTLTEIDGPYIEANEVVGGYVLFAANNFEEAVATARACPGLNYRMCVEVRPVLAGHCESAC